MSDDKGTESAVTESVAGQNTGSPTAPPPANPPANPQPDLGKHFESFNTTLTALPELIAKSVQEAIGKANPPAKAEAPKADEKKEETAKVDPPKVEVPGRKGWDGGNWWFS